MSLLQGLLGFGAGAAGAFAEQKKADIDAQRQANLARLQAQYKGQAQIEQARKVAGLATSEDPEERAMASVLGYSPAEAEDNRTALQRNAEAAFPDDPEMQRQFIRRGGKIGVDAPETVDTWSQGGFDYGRLSDGSVVRFDARAPGGMRLVSGGGQLTQTQGGEPPPKLLRRGDSEQQISASPPPEKSVMERMDEILGEGVSNIPPEDVISLGTGPIDTMKAVGLRVPIIGDLLAASGDQSGPAQRRARTNLNYIMNRVITTYKQNDGRTSNAEMELNKLLAPEGGLFSTDSSYYSDLIGLRRNLIADIRRNANIVEDTESAVPTFSADDAAAAREFLRGSYGALQTIDGYLTAYGFQNETIPVNGRRVRIRDLSQNDIMSLGPDTQITPQQYDLIDAWEKYNNWK